MLAKTFLHSHNVWLALIFGLFSTQLLAQDGVLPETVLGYQPTQKDVVIETPKPEEVKQCKLKVEQHGNGSGWALYGPQGQLLRRFIDTDGNQRVDEFKYYQYGLEVYRDLDTNGDDKIDQSRWLNTQGTRWGIDSDQDGKIDSWKMISAEEATREAILAMANRDPHRLQAVFISEADVKALGLTQQIGDRFLANRAEITAQMQKILGSTKVLTPKTQWARFDSSMLMPNLIPADAGKASNDLLVYENVMAIVMNDEESGFVQIGEMIKIGDAWKLTQVPKPIEGNQFEVAEGGLLLQPAIAGMPAGSTEGLTPEMKELLDQLQELDSKSPTAESTREEMVRFNVARAQLLDKIGEQATSPEDKKLWLRQRLEMIATATQMDAFPNGLQVLQQSIQKLRSQDAAKDLIAFAVFQEMVLKYNTSLQTAQAEDRAEVQSAWLKSLEEFVKEFPEAPESADALLQLAITSELNGNAKEARVWYTNLVTDYSSSQAAKRGEGALRRLGLEGQPITLAGATLGSGRPLSLASYRGKVTAIIFWATWCKPCTEDLPQIQELHRTYQRDGFEVVGVNLDSQGADIDGYLKNNRVAWPHIYEEGGLESRPALEYGIYSLPTMFLVDKTGKVVSNSASVDDLKKLVPQLVKQ